MAVAGTPAAHPVPVDLGLAERLAVTTRLGDMTDEEILLAPFACGTQWQGSTYSGHGQDNLSLDLNRTSLVWPDPLHDLGQPVLAQGGGTVVWVANDGSNGGAGAYVEIDYGDPP